MLPQCTAFVLRCVIPKLDTVVQSLNRLRYAPLLPWQSVSRRWRRAVLMENPITARGHLASRALRSNGSAEPKLPPLQTHRQAAATRHKRSIVVSMAEGTFCTGYAESRLIQIRNTGHVSWRLKVGSEKRRLEKPPRIITDCSFRSLVFS